MSTRVVTGELTRLTFAAVVAALVGCSGAPEGDALGSVRQAETAFANDKLAYDYFRAKGLTNFQAAGVVGNLDQESGIDPTISQYGGGPGRGIAQWSTGGRWDTADGDNVREYAAQRGQSEYSLELQLDFVWYELSTFPEYGLSELQGASTLEEATQAFEDRYEGCVYANYPVCALPSRIAYAQDVLDNYGSDPSPVTPGDDAGADPSEQDAGAGGDGDGDGDTGDGDGDTGDGDGDTGDGDGDTGDGDTNPPAGDGDTAAGDGDDDSEGDGDGTHAGDGDDSDSSDSGDHTQDDAAMTGASCATGRPGTTSSMPGLGSTVVLMVAPLWLVRRRRALSR